MNINDIENIPHPKPEDYLHVIWERQTSLLDKYKEIEGIPDYPFDIDSAEHQIWIKDFLWRVVEEIMEACEANREAGLGSSLAHTIEELADALHFIVGTMILCGVEPSSWDLGIIAHDAEFFNDEMTTLEEAAFAVCYEAGLTGNTLKNKRWKQTSMQTDIHKFTELLQATFKRVIGTFITMGVSVEEIFIYYFKKSEVNKFRQRTNY